MRRRIILLILLIVCAVSVTACSDDRKDGGAVTPSVTTGPTVSEPSKTPTPAMTPTTVITPESTGTPTPAVTPEATPGPDPQASITPASELAAMIARNRELHEAVRPKTVANPLGTATVSKLSEKDAEYGIARTSRVNCTLIDPVTGEDVSWDTEISVRALRVSGLINGNVQEKINERILSAVRTMIDPGYIPNAAGILTIIRERGLPESMWLLPEELYNKNGLLTIGLKGHWYWTEEREFSTSKEFDDFRETVVWPYDFSYQSLDDHWIYPLTIRLIYSVPEEIYLNFDLATGEEMSLSDLFPKGTDYLSLLNEKAVEDSKYYYWFIHDEGPDGTYDETREYDGGALLPTIRGDEQFYPGQYSELTIFSEQGQRIKVYGIGTYSGSDNGESLYQVNEYVTMPIGTAYFSVDPELSDDLSEYRTNVGSFRAKPYGDREITVTVYRSREPAYSECKEFDAENLTDARILEIAEQCVAYWADEGLPNRDFSLLLDSAEVYPNGYGISYWTVVCRESNGGNTVELSMQAWVKAGKVVSKE